MFGFLFDNTSKAKKKTATKKKAKASSDKPARKKGEKWIMTTITGKKLEMPPPRTYSGLADYACGNYKPESDEYGLADIIQKSNRTGYHNTGNMPDYSKLERWWGANSSKVNISSIANKPMRKGIPVEVYTDTAYFVEYFGLRSVEFGNWTNQGERAKFLYACADALLEIADVLGIKPQDIGCHNKLTFSFGSRGVPRSAASYTPQPIAVINITKPHITNGSLGHEYAHAIDNLISYYVLKNKGTYVTYDFELKDFLNGKARGIATKSKYHKAVESAISTYLTKDVVKKLQNDTDYYQRTEEMLARCTEVFFRAKTNSRNSLLVKPASALKGHRYPNADTLDLSAIKTLLSDGVKDVLLNTKPDNASVKVREVIVEKEVIKEVPGKERIVEKIKEVPGKERIVEKIVKEVDNEAVNKLVAQRVKEVETEWKNKLEEQKKKLKEDYEAKVRKYSQKDKRGNSIIKTAAAPSAPKAPTAPRVEPTAPASSSKDDAMALLLKKLQEAKEDMR